MTNSYHIHMQLNRRCTKDHRHVVLLNGRAKHAAIYPDKLCEAICQGLSKQLKHDEMISRTPVYSKVNVNVCDLIPD